MSSPLDLLLVDDDTPTLDGLKRSLKAERPSWSVRAVASGQAALIEMAKKVPDVVISDLMMPRMDGAEFSREVLHRFPWIARIMLTGRVDLDSYRQGSRWSQRFLTKPCPIDILCREVEATALRRDGDRNAAIERRRSTSSEVQRPVLLVVEDDPLDLSMLCQALADQGIDIDVRHAEHGAGALAYLDLARERQDSPVPDVILLDVVLPQMNAWEFLARYRATAVTPAPILVCSGFSDEKLAAEAVLHGASTFIPKPTTWDRWLDMAGNVARFAQLVRRAQPRKAS